MPVLEETYGELLFEVLPAVIETAAQYDSLSTRLSALVRKGRGRTIGETKLMKLLAVLIHDFDERNALPHAQMTPQEAIGFLLEHSGKTAADLVSVFGQRSHVTEALTGKRKISAEQARKLAKTFSVNPGLFIRV